MTWHIGRGDEGGQASARSVFVMTGGLALVTAACIGGGVLTGGGGGTTTTTTAPPTTTTTSTTVAPTTTTTVGGGDPCAAINTTTTGFPCTANAGVHGVTFTAANTTNNNGSTCTVCPPGMTYSAGNGYRITSCTTIDRWKITGDVDVVIGNGKKGIYGTEAAAIANACVKITNTLFQPPEPGRTSDVALSTGFSNFNLASGCGGSACGPVYMADSEVAMSHPSAAGTCGNDGSGAPIPCNSGFSYTVSDTNLHLWRVYLHGTSQGIDSDGYSEVHDSIMRADRSDQLTIDTGVGEVDHCKIGPSGFGIAVPSGGAGIHDHCSGHGDAYFQDSGSAPWLLVDHSSLFCGAAHIDCNVDGAFIGDGSAPDGGVISHNLFKASSGVNFCQAAGVSEGSKPFPTGSNINIKNNVYEIGSGACTHTNAVKTYDPSTAASHNDTFCNNRMDDGTLVNAAYETGGCP